MRDYEEHHGREEFAPSDLYGAVGVALAARLPRGRIEMATWNNGPAAVATIELPALAEDVSAWLAFTAAPQGRWMTSLKQWGCSCCGLAIFPGTRYFYGGSTAEGSINVCRSCMRVKEVTGC